MALVRKQVYIELETDRELRQEAKRRGVSQATLIRERLKVRCVHVTKTTGDEASRRRFLALLRRNQQEALKYVGRESGRKFDRMEAYEERLERQMPR